MTVDSAFRHLVEGRAATAGVDLDAKVLEGLECYVGLLAKWNQRINLTALTIAPLSAAAVDRLLIEPLAAVRFFPSEARLWVDLGSGGGSPAIPLKLALPRVELRMVEARARKASFLREVCRCCHLTSTVVRNERIEDVVNDSELARTVDVVTVRGVAMDSTLEAAVVGLLRKGGKLLAFSGGFEKRPNLLEPAHAGRDRPRPSEP